MTQLNVAQNYCVQMQIVQNDFAFEPQQLFDMAMRINEKRRFLFVSKVLGKHLALAPEVPLLTARLLAHQFLQLPIPQGQAIAHALKTNEHVTELYQVVKHGQFHMTKPVRIIGFAETATALGHGFFECFSGDVAYVHTTREHLLDTAPIVTFEEEHSHASTHRLYGSPDFFVKDAHIVLVDDEMTTGQTNLNIIRQLHTRFPYLTNFTLVAILDWRTEAHLQAMHALAKELQITIEAVSLLAGQIAVDILQPLPEEVSAPNVASAPAAPIHRLQLTRMQSHRSKDEVDTSYDGRYFQWSGRFSMSASDQYNLQQKIPMLAKQIEPLRKGKSCLVIGTGEFMYVPLQLAIALGQDVKFHATTRSPILPHAETVIYERFQFESIEMPGVMNYLYNVPNEAYDTIFIVTERLFQPQAAQHLAEQLHEKCANIHIISFGGECNGTEYANNI